MRFKEWYLLEMGDITTTDLSKVELTPIGGGLPAEFGFRPAYGGLNYFFTVNNQYYHAYFYGPRSWTPDVPDGQGGFKTLQISKKLYEVGFKKDGSYELVGNTSNPTAVYMELLKGLKKLIEQENPDALTFYGADTRQDVMYDKFYNSYLKPYFTRVGAEHYLRNDVYENFKKQGGPEWEFILTQEKSGSHYLQNKLNAAKAERDRERAQRRERATMAKGFAIPRVGG